MAAEQAKVSDAVRVSVLETLKTTDSIAAALDRFRARNITSAPVIDASNGLCWGFFDVVDAIVALVNKCREEKESKLTPPSTDLNTDDLTILAARANEFTLTRLDKVVDLSKNNAYYPIRQDQSLRDAINIFVKGVHRVAITDVKNDVVSQLSQSDLIAWLLEDPKRIPAGRGLTKAGEMHWLHKRVSTVRKNVQTYRAFEVLQSSGHNAVAVVDDMDRICGVLSASDAKLIDWSISFDELLLPVHEFLERVQPKRKASDVITAGADTQLRDILSLMHTNQVHRVFIVDADQKIQAICTMTDIIRDLFPY